MIAGRLGEVEPLLEDAERGLASDGVDPESTALVSLMAAIRAAIAVLSGDVSRIVELTRQALGCLPEDPAGMTGIRSWIRGMVCLFASQTAVTSRTFSEAISSCQATGATSMVALETYAYGLLELERGHFGQAGAAYRRALATLSGRGEAETPVAGLVYLALGELLRIQNDLAAAEPYLLEGLRLAARLNNTGALVQGYISLAWLQEAQGDVMGAHATLDEAEELAQGNSWSRALALLRAHRARLQITQGDLSAADAWAGEHASGMGRSLGSAEPRLLRHTETMTWALLRITQGRREEALAVLEGLRAEAEDAGWLRLRISSTVLMALAWQASGDVKQALAVLEEALLLARPEINLGLFADSGLPMAKLLAEGARRASWRNPDLQPYVVRLLAELGASGSRELKAQALRFPTEARPAEAARTQPIAGLSVPAAPLVEPLSDRELEVLRLVATGLSNRMIADRLYVSVATVKTHTHHIYAKLGVSDRHQAPLRASQLGLL